jgi:hypothetical protein
MSYRYRNRFSYQDCAPRIKLLRDHLQKHAKLITDVEFQCEAYFVDSPDPLIRQEFQSLYALPCAGGFVRLAPLGDGTLVIFNPEADGAQPTVSRTHIRLPKLSHLITLSPSDFFLFMRLIATAANSNAVDVIKLNPPAAGVNAVPAILDPFFFLVRVNYRITPEYADHKWTLRGSIHKVAFLDETRDNQLAAMQYLTALQNPDLLYFPLEAAIDLELDWEQMDDDYCIPSAAKVISSRRTIRI